MGNFIVLRAGFRKILKEAVIEGEVHAIPTLDCSLFAIVCVVFVLIFVCFVAGLNLAWTALAGAVLVMVVARRDTHEVLKLVDWHLLVFFAALFVVVDGLSDTGLPDAIYTHLQPVFGSRAAAQTWNLTWFSIAGSNIFSNVPFVLVAGKWIPHFADPVLMWKVLALATTFAGNLTIIGSVANMIVVESAREHLEIGFWDYARVGNSCHAPHDCRRYPCATRVALRNRLYRMSASTARRCGEGIGVSFIEINHCCPGAICLGGGRRYTASVIR